MLTRKLKEIYFQGAFYSGLPSLVNRFAGNQGVIICLHRVVSVGELSTFGNRSIEISDRCLIDLIRSMKQAGYRFISLDDALTKMQQKSACIDPFAVVTFDDGYLDNYERAYPLLKGEEVPFTIYLTTSFMDRSVDIWWYALEKALTHIESVRFSEESEPTVLSSILDRSRAFRQLRNLYLVASTDQRQRILRNVVGSSYREILKDLANSMTMSWENVRTLAKDPLVTIGAHTISHPALSLLQPEEAEREILESKELIERILGQPVNHFAYPFGSRMEASEREYRLTEQLGFKSAVTTVMGSVRQGNSKFALPRVPVSGDLYGRAQVEVHRSGVSPLLLSLNHRLGKFFSTR